MADLAEIIKRLEKASGPDRELDGDIAVATAEAPSGSERMWGLSPAGECFATGPYSRWIAPCYTASIDGAVALVERILPGWNGDLDIAKPIAANGNLGARLFPSPPEWTNYAGEGKTSAIALLVALFRALEAQEPKQ